MSSLLHAAFVSHKVADEYAAKLFSHEPTQTISKIFHRLFGNPDDNIMTWLEIFSTHIQITRVAENYQHFNTWVQSDQGRIAKDSVNYMLKELKAAKDEDNSHGLKTQDHGCNFSEPGYRRSIDKETHSDLVPGYYATDPTAASHAEAADTRLFDFLVCLFYAYAKLIESGYYRDDNIFGFTGGFPVKDTRVVIVGNEPADVYSSGYSFHASICESTEIVIDKINLEMSMLSEIFGDYSFEMSSDELEEAKENCSLKGLIDQGVLFLNVKLTPGMMEGVWDIFTDFILEYLSKQDQPLVFMLAGTVALEKQRFINQNLHLCMCIYHPYYYCSKNKNFYPREDKDWYSNIPFLNANLFLMQTRGKRFLIDWTNFSGDHPQKNRIELFHSGIHFVLNNLITHFGFTQHRTISGHRILKKSIMYPKQQFIDFASGYGYNAHKER